MDDSRFDCLTRSLSTPGSRRRALGGLLAGVLGLLGYHGKDTAAKKKKPCPPCKKRKKGKCKATLPDGTACSGGTCQSGSCRSASVDPPPPPPPPPPPVCTPACTGGRVCQSDQVCGCPSGTRECFNGNCGACCTNFDCCTPPDGQVICPPGSPTCLDTIPRVCGCRNDQVLQGNGTCACRSDLDPGPNGTCVCRNARDMLPNGSCARRCDIGTDCGVGCSCHLIADGPYCARDISCAEMTQSCRNNAECPLGQGCNAYTGCPVATNFKLGASRSARESGAYGVGSRTGRIPAAGLHARRLEPARQRLMRRCPKCG